MSIPKGEFATNSTSTEIILRIGEGLVKMTDIAVALDSLPVDEFLTAIRSLIAAGHGDHLKLLLDGVDIQMTKTSFDDPSRVNALEETASDYPFSMWLGQMDKPLTKATRSDIMSFWEMFTQMASKSGFEPGAIDGISRQTNLWKATGALATKMMEDPAKYRFLPGLLINHPQEVARVLGEINDPEAFLEVLVGERFEDMVRSPAFLGAFSTVEKDGEISRTVNNALCSVLLALQRSTK